MRCFRAARCRIGWMVVFGCVVACVLTAAARPAAGSDKVERWGIFEVSLRGPAGGNPFLDVRLSARFTHGQKVLTPEGFYDGGGVYRIRFMPTELGEWTYVTKSNRRELDGKTGRFTCVGPSPGNRGPVRVRNTWHFAYADGTPYFQIGTTCYAWAHQGERMEQQTLATLRKAPFNKMRMCVFPKSYAYNKNEPRYYPFEGRPLTKWDFTRFNPEFFRHFEKRVADLRDLGIEADLILFHPYDRWGFKSMDSAADDRYLRYVVARLSAYRNVWWSLANEFDLMFKIKNKKMSDWDRFFRIIRDSDPYGHLRSIHNCRTWYDHTRPWVTHASVQSSDLQAARGLRKKYRKPIVYDECKYEGDIPKGWGSISASQMVHRFWLGAIAGCYVGHGETYKHPKDILWWSKGGVLHGQSPVRIAFLKKIMSSAPFARMTPSGLPGGQAMLARPGELYFVYFTRPTEATLALAGKGPYKADGFDTWEMTATALADARGGTYRFRPPKGNYLLRLSAYAPGEKPRPSVAASADKTEGRAPLKVRFSAATRLACRWSFGDGAESAGAEAVHVYEKPGFYTATATVTDEDGRSASATLGIAVAGKPGEAIVRVGFAGGDSPAVKLHGKIARGADGAYDLGDGKPWKWISVGDRPVEALKGLRSFTILGWLKASSLATGSGGNRIAFNLNYNRAGFDLVCRADGRLRLAVNEWPDKVRNDSSPGKVRVGRWTFFAVTYDAAARKDNVRWYFGGAGAPAELDRTTSYSRGPTGGPGGVLTIGNYNETIHRHGLDRQFRGRLRGIQIFGSQTGAEGALTLSAIRTCQRQR